MLNPSPIKHICFDLDGTLTDSVKTIFMSTLKTLEKLNIPNSLTIEDFSKRVGHHFKDMFIELDIPVKDFDEYITIYKNHYFDFINYSSLYAGAVETLQVLKNKGITLSLCTTKVQSQAEKVTEYFGIQDYFSIILGRIDNIQSKPSPEPLLYICNKLSICPESTLMVGDTEVDIECGKNANAKTCGTAYGYRGAGLLQIENPDFIINDITELQNLF